MSRDPSRRLEEARKKGGFPLYDAITGRVAIVPEKVMRCPRCDGMVARKTAPKRADRTTPEGQPIYKCNACSIEFAQTTKELYCDYLVRNITKLECVACPIKEKFMPDWHQRARERGGYTPDDPFCPYFKMRLGMDYKPEGWFRDNELEK